MQEAVKLTGAVWAGFVSHTGNDFELETVSKLPQDSIEPLLEILRDAKFADRPGNGKANQHAYMVSPILQETLHCVYLYIVEISGQSFIVVGVREVLSSHALGIWKLVAHFNNAVNPEPANVEVGLLQNNVFELQQTQQELQARISAQREAEARLIQAAKLAAVGEMAAGVAHELNNPLTSVVGFTELALDELPVDAAVRSDLELVLKEARRARSVVRRLLDFARQAETVRVKADINEIVDDMLVLTKHLMQTNNVQPVVKMGKNLAWVSVDRNQIKQVVINLVNNALYAMPGGGRLDVETAEQTRFGRPWITFSIRDTGVGISPENLERIFEPFFTTRGDRGGTGLGLSVTYGIVTDHGGMIEVESQLHVGSNFIVWLPLDQAV